jgi:NDP-sugar pyrophosphorylase family protein
VHQNKNKKNIRRRSVMKGARIVVYVNDDGEVIGARNVHPDTGVIGDDNIQYGKDEIAANKRIHGGAHKTKLRYPNVCCWKYMPGVGWICVAC